MYFEVTSICLKMQKFFCFDTAQHDVTSHAYPISAHMWIVYCFCLYFSFLMSTVDVNISFFSFVISKTLRMLWRKCAAFCPQLLEVRYERYSFTWPFTIDNMTLL